MSFLKALPALLVLILFPVVVLAAALAVVALIVLVILFLHSRIGLYAGVVLLVGLIGGLVYAVKELGRAPKPSLDGPAPSRQAAPQLWAMADELAAGVGTRPVDAIIITAEVNAAVAKVGGHRVMFIGLPLLATFSQAELRAVLAHELGHYAGGRFALSSALLRAQNALVTVARNSTGVWGYLFRAYARLYVAAAQLSSRDLERAADSFAMRLGGPRQTASAFRRIIAVDLAWDQLNEQYFGYFRSAGARASLVEGLQRLIGANTDELLTAADRVIAEQKARWDDSHPLIRERIARALAASSNAPADDAGAPALALVPGGLEPAERALLTAGEAPLKSWDEVMSAGETAARHEQAAAVTGQLLAARLIAVPTAREVLAAQSRGPVGAPFAQDHSQIGEASQAVLSLICTDALLHSGAARPVPRWDGPIGLVGPDGPVEISRLLGDGGPEAMSEAARELERRGARLDDPYPLPRQEQGPAADELVGAVTNAQMRMRDPYMDLWIFPSGLLFLRSRSNGFKLMAGAARADRQAERLQRRLAENGLQKLKAAKGSTWIPREAVEEICVLPGGVDVRVRGRRKPYRVVDRQYTAVLGDLEQTLPPLFPGAVTGPKHVPIGAVPEPTRAA